MDLQQLLYVTLIGLCILKNCHGQEDASKIFIKVNDQSVIESNHEFEFGETKTIYNVKTEDGYVLTVTVDTLMKCNEGQIKIHGDDGVFIRHYCEKKKQSSYPVTVTGSEMNITIVCKTLKGKCVNSGQGMSYQLTVYSRLEPHAPPPSPPNPSSKCRCGTTAINKIVGGENAAPGEIPWQVLIKYYVGSRHKTFCGGSLISDKYIVTSAKCLKGGIHDDLIVILGTVDIDQQMTSKFVKRVKSVQMHEDYDEHTGQNDIALVELQEKIVYNNDIQAVCLPARLINMPLTEKVMTISGWGAENETSEYKQRLLKKTTVEALSFYDCEKVYEGGAKYNQMCAERECHDVCKHDEGGPLTLVDNGIHYLMGVTSYSNCDRVDLPSVYTRVTGYVRWIFHNTGGRICFK